VSNKLGILQQQACEYLVGSFSTLSGKLLINQNLRSFFQVDRDDYKIKAQNLPSFVLLKLIL